MITEKALSFIFLGFIMVFLLEACSKNSPERNKIIFRDATFVVQDSLESMNAYMDRLPKKEVINFFFDQENSIYINSRKIGKVAHRHKISFLKIVHEETGLSETESLKFISLAAYLKDNYINGCYRHANDGLYFYAYLQTADNEFDDQRNIVIFGNWENAKGSPINSYQVLDRKSNLLLIAPVDAKIR